MAAIDVKATVKAQQALALKLEGRTYQEIADQLHYASKGAAFTAIHRELSRHPVEDIATLRAIETARLDDLYGKLHGVLTNPSQMLFAVDRLLKVMERRSKLLGLDKPPAVDAGMGDQLAALLVEIASATAGAVGEPEPDATEDTSA